VKVLILILIVCAGFYFTPQFMEGTSTPCTALVSIRLRQDGAKNSSPIDQAFGRIVESTVGDALAKQQMAREHPHTPPELSCAVSYWGRIV